MMQVRPVCGYERGSEAAGKAIGWGPALLLVGRTAVSG